MPPRTDKASPATSFEAWPEHPLFPVEEGERTPEVVYIQITRIDRGVQFWGPVLRADELTSTDDLFEMFGGGHYELWARGPSKLHADRPGNITKKKRFVLPGRSKPMSKDPTAEEIRQVEGTARGFGAVEAAPAPAAAPSSSGGSGEGLLVAVLNMQQQSAQNFMTLMMTMLSESKKEAAENSKLQAAQQQQFAQMMMTLSAQQQQSMIGMMTAMLQSRGGGPDEMAKYADLLRKLGMGGPKTDDAKEDAPGFGKMLEDAADFVQGVVALKGAAPVVPNGVPVAPLPGTAAAVAAEMGVK